MDLPHRAFGAAPFFACRLHSVGTSLRLELAGEVDLAARPELDRLLSQADAARDGGPVVIDMTAVSFLDSTGLHWLVRAREAIAGSGGRLVVTVDDGPVRDVLALSGIDRTLGLVPAPPEG